MHQKDIAQKLGITAQAVSEYVIALKNEGLVATQGRSKYVVTKEGVGWAIGALRELQDYAAFAGEAMTNITVCAAIAAADLSRDQVVGLAMKDGVLYADPQPAGGARGMTVSGAMKGEDVGITNVEGIVDLKPGKITVLNVPGIRRGGSRAADIARLKKALNAAPVVGCKGIEAMACVRRAGLNTFYAYGVGEAAIEAAHCGLPFLIVCTEDELSSTLKRLEAEALEYTVHDLTGKQRHRWDA